MAEGVPCLPGSQFAEVIAGDMIQVELPSSYEFSTYRWCAGCRSMTTRAMRTKALSIWDQGCMRWTQVAVSFTGGKAAERRKMYEAHFVVPERGRDVFEVRKTSETSCGSQGIRCPCFQASLSRPEFGFSMLHYPLQLYTTLCNLSNALQCF